MTFRMVRPLSALAVGCALLVPAFDAAHAAKRHIVVTAVEPKGGGKRR